VTTLDWVVICCVLILVELVWAAWRGTPPPPLMPTAHVFKIGVTINITQQDDAGCFAEVGPGGYAIGDAVFIEQAGFPTQRFHIGDWTYNPNGAKLQLVRAKI
jgi:hypothetical protein